jgi:DNA-binding MarR family transcriptional regulator
MSSRDAGLSVDDGVRTLLLLMPRMVSRVKRIRIPDELQSLALAPRHLSLLSYLLFDGPLSVKELARRLEVAPTTVSLMVADLSRQGVVERTEDPTDRRRTIVGITDERRPSIAAWLSQGARAWRKTLEPLTPGQRKMFVDTLARYEQEVLAELGD